MTPEQSNKIIREELDSFIEEVKRNMDENNKNATGRARRGFYYEFDTPLTATVYGVPYSGALQRGIRPRTWPRGLALRIQEWAKAKGIKFRTTKELVNFSHAVAYSIMTRGTIQHRTNKYVDIYDTPFDKCLNQITNRLTDKTLYDLIFNIGI